MSYFCICFSPIKKSTTLPTTQHVQDMWRALRATNGHCSETRQCCLWKHYPWKNYFCSTCLAAFFASCFLWFLRAVLESGLSLLPGGFIFWGGSSSCCRICKINSYKTCIPCWQACCYNKPNSEPQNLLTTTPYAKMSHKGRGRKNKGGKKKKYVPFFSFK